MAPLSLLLVCDGALVVAPPRLPPYSTPALTANLVLRVLLAAVANAACLVPLRLLCRRGELAAAVFVAAVELLNLETLACALLWRDDVSAWWPSLGFCDADAFVHNAATGLYASCLLAVMRSLAQRVALRRARPLTARERRCRCLRQALVVLPLPAVQLALTWPVAAQRFHVATLAGCVWIPHPSWPNLVFFVLAPVALALATAAYAALAYLRFRRAAQASALSRSREAARRSLRTKRRLYMMVLSILVPFLPVVVALAVANILTRPRLQPYSYHSVHHDAAPLPWNSITFRPSSTLSWASLNNCYIPILTAIPVFLFFGMTKDALDQYRAVGLFLGLGTLFPRLRDEYGPERGPASATSFHSSHTSSRSRGADSKISSSTSSRHFDSLRSFSAGSSHESDVRAIDFSFAGDLGGGSVQRPEPLFLPRSRTDDVPGDAAHRRNPFLFQTSLALPIPFRLPVWEPGARAGPEPEPPVVPLEPMDSTAPLGPWDCSAAAVPHSQALTYTSPPPNMPHGRSKR